MDVNRLNKNLKQPQNPMEQLETKTTAVGDEEKVPMEGLKKQITDIEEAIANFERLLTLEDKN